MPKSPDYVPPQFLTFLAKMIRSLKNETYEYLDIKNGNKILDIGCGPGVDTVELAKHIDSTGKIFGIDMDEEMISIADEEAIKNNLSDKIEHKVGIAQNIPYPDNFFNSCRAERVFQVIPEKVERDKVYEEIKRILIPNGKVVLIDVDFATLSIDYSDINIERKLVEYFTTKMRSNGIAGRELKRGLLNSGFNNVEIIIKPGNYNSFEQMPFMGKQFIDRAISDHIISEDDGNNWLTELTNKTNNGTFFAMNNALVATGIKNA